LWIIIYIWRWLCFFFFLIKSTQKKHVFLIFKNIIYIFFLKNHNTWRCGWRSTLYVFNHFFTWLGLEDSPDRWTQLMPVSFSVVFFIRFFLPFSSKNCYACIYFFIESLNFIKCTTNCISYQSILIFHFFYFKLLCFY
jgi:hypothetical protein